MLHLAHLRYLKWANDGHIQCGNHTSQNNCIWLHKTVKQLINKPKVAKLYREKLSTSCWYLQEVENFVLGLQEVENFVNSLSLGDQRVTFHCPNAR